MRKSEGAGEEREGGDGEEHSLLDCGEGTTPEWSGVDRRSLGWMDIWMDDPDEAQAFVYLFQRQPSTPLNCFLIRTHVQQIHGVHAQQYCTTARYQVYPLEKGQITPLKYDQSLDDPFNYLLVQFGL